MSAKNISAFVMNTLIPMVLVLSVVRGIFFNKWFAGQTVTLPVNVICWFSFASLVAFVLYLVLPKLDDTLRMVLALSPVLIWLTVVSSVPMPAIFRSGALESLSESVEGYMIAIPFGLVYVRYIQISTTLMGKISSAVFAFLFIFWAVAASLMREQW